MSKLMHNVRAYTFCFVSFYISAYTTLNELLAVFFIYNIGIFATRHSIH